MTLYREPEAALFATLRLQGLSIPAIARICKVSINGLKKLELNSTGRDYKINTVLIGEGKIKPSIFINQFKTTARNQLKKSRKNCAAARASQNKMLITIIDERIEEKVKPKLSMISRIIIGIVNKIKQWFRK